MVLIFDEKYMKGPVGDGLYLARLTHVLCYIRKTLVCELAKLIEEDPIEDIKPTTQVGEIVSVKRSRRWIKDTSRFVFNRIQCKELINESCRWFYPEILREFAKEISLVRFLYRYVRRPYVDTRVLDKLSENRTDITAISSLLLRESNVMYGSMKDLLNADNDGDSYCVSHGKYVRQQQTQTNFFL